MIDLRGKSPRVLTVAREWAEDEADAGEQVWRELLTVEKAIDEMGEAAMRGHSVQVLSDAVGVVRYINWGAGPSKVMSRIMKRIFNKCVARCAARRRLGGGLSGGVQ